MFTAYASTDPFQVQDVVAQWTHSHPLETTISVGDNSLAIRSQYKEIAQRGTAAGELVVCGRVRLDDRDVQDDPRASDVVRVCRTFATGSLSDILAMNGTFGIVTWDPRNRTLYAIRDALGVRPIYYRLLEDGIYLSDNLEEFAQGATFDRRYLAAFLATGCPVVEQTIWSGVNVVLPGHFVEWANGRLSGRRYWSADAFPQDLKIDEPAAAAELRRLITTAVGSHFDAGTRVWADLSGGLDSSTVVSVAGMLFKGDSSQGLRGTTSIVDTFGLGDETRFSDTVVRKFQVRNEQVHEPWPWRDDGLPPPITEHPTRDYPYYARERQTAALLQADNATVHLAGTGPDLCLPAASVHVADLVSTGQVRRGITDLWLSAQTHRQRIWHAAAHDLVLPLAPRAIQKWYWQRKTPAPNWLRPQFTREFGFEDHAIERRLVSPSPGRVCQSLLGHLFLIQGCGLPGWRILGPVDVRHPLLHRPLVEFCLRLPHRLRTHPVLFKPLLRIAMKGIVPDKVLVRRTKGSGMMPRISWALGAERERIKSLLSNSVLADLGCLEPNRLLSAVDMAASGKPVQARYPYLALSLESWLAVRSGKQYITREKTA